MVRVAFSIGGATTVAQMAQQVTLTLQDWTPALSQSAEDLLTFIENDVFDTEGDAIDEPWQELSPKYAVRKEKIYPGSPILVGTGEMRDSFEATVEPTQLLIGNSSEYFVYHQSSAPRTKMPRRVMLAITGQMIDMVMANFEAQIQEALGSV